jgi:transposase
LRERVIEAVAAGASRREAAESFSLSASSAVRWLQRWRLLLDPVHLAVEVDRP